MQDFFHPLLAVFSTPHESYSTALILILILITVGLPLLLDFLVDFLCLAFPLQCFIFFAPITSFFLLLFSPITIFFLKLIWFISPKETLKESSSLRVREKILEIFHESELSPYLDPNDQKLILSMLSFKERIAREVMVPRIDMFSLPAETTIEEAAKSILKQGYSRIPVYKETVDNIAGVLHYKDVLKLYAKVSQKEELEQKLTAPIESLLKPVLYTPETKKISTLLQEFRNKQMHLAIVVDEYGGTEGIVTIEDILEELVGEIADEYDIDEEVLFSALPGGAWIVDAKMSIIDIQEELGITIPQNPEYDTLGGYIVHRAGYIPAKGWKIHQDTFDIEVLSSNDRSIDKIRIVPHELSE
jgi:CBS domain containing-hemolysin-like protein